MRLYAGYRAKFTIFCGDMQNHTQVIIKTFKFNHIWDISRNFSVIYQNTKFEKNVLACSRNCTPLKQYTRVYM
jgi:hypothetical protein